MRRLLLAPLLAAAIVLPSCTATTAGDDAATTESAAPLPQTRAAPAASRRGDVVGVVQRVLPAVVNVVAEVGGGRGEGTGFVIRQDGIIVTNYHVVEGAGSLAVLTSEAEPTRYEARVIGGDPTKDLAVLKVDATGLPTVPLGNSDSLELGQEVVAIGYALGLDGGPSVTTGVVSSLNRVVRARDQNCPQGACPGGTRTYDHVIQTDAAINPGNSGGPLVDLAGRVIGINTAGAGAAVADNIGFAIQINAAEQTILDAAQNPDAPVAYLGVGSADASDPRLQLQLSIGTDRGAAIINVVPGGPAERAGIQVGDVIVSFDGRGVDDSATLGTLIRDHEPGDTVEVEVVRPDGSTETVTAELGTNPLP
jgi:S1-C subfamily serine protease